MLAIIININIYVFSLQNQFLCPFQMLHYRFLRNRVCRWILKGDVDVLTWGFSKNKAMLPHRQLQCVAHNFVRGEAILTL